MDRGVVHGVQWCDARDMTKHEGNQPVKYEVRKYKPRRGNKESINIPTCSRFVPGHVHRVPLPADAGYPGHGPSPVFFWGPDRLVGYPRALRVTTSCSWPGALPGYLSRGLLSLVVGVCPRLALARFAA
eukprot:3185878-Pyramimonas_sp.AAC.1